MIVKCPRCGRKSETASNPFRPFCSERCKLLDLGNWLSGDYRIAAQDTPEDGDQTTLKHKDPDKE